MWDLLETVNGDFKINWGSRKLLLGAIGVTAPNRLLCRVQVHSTFKANRTTQVLRQKHLLGATPMTFWGGAPTRPDSPCLPHTGTNGRETTNNGLI